MSARYCIFLLPCFLIGGSFLSFSNAWANSDTVCAGQLTSASQMIPNSILERLFNAPLEIRSDVTRVLADELSEVGHPFGSLLTYAIELHTPLDVRADISAQKLLDYSQRQVQLSEQIDSLFATDVSGWFTPDLRTFLKPFNNTSDLETTLSVTLSPQLREGPFVFGPDGVIQALRLRFKSAHSLLQFRKKKVAQYLMNTGVREIKWSLPYGHQTPYTGIQRQDSTRYGLHQHREAPSDLARLTLLKKSFDQTDHDASSWSFEQIPNLESETPSRAYSHLVQPGDRLELGFVPVTNALGALARAPEFATLRHIGLRTPYPEILNSLGNVRGRLESLNFGLQSGYGRRAQGTLTEFREALSAFESLKHLSFELETPISWSGATLQVLARRMPLESLQISVYGSRSVYRGKSLDSPSITVMRGLGAFRRLKSLKVALKDESEQDLADLEAAINQLPALERLELGLSAWMSSQALNARSKWRAKWLKKMARTFPKVEIKFFYFW